MSVALSSLIPFLRISLNDTESGYYQYQDAELLNALTFGIQVQEGSWNQGYEIVSSAITPDPPTWLQMLYVIKTCIMMRSFVSLYSYDNGAIKVTKTSKKDDLEALLMLYNEIIDARKDSSACFAFNAWDDYLTRRDKILNEVGLNG